MGADRVGECARDYANSRLIVMWGWSPGDGHFGTSTFEYLKWARRSGTRIVCVDPRVTHTSLQLADEHVLIRPSTDTAMLIAMAYVVVTEGLHDTEFCDRLVLGLDEAHLPPGAPPGSSWRSYQLGLSDAIRKTPEWAEPITGVPAATIRRLAMEFAAVKPRRCIAAMRPDGRCMASSSIALPIRSRRSPAMSVSLAAIPD
jgi:anaerobic dimethyl sulfoxide reductase subunit A